MKHQRKRSRRGVALVAAVGLTFLVLALGAALLGMSTSELTASKAQADSIVARNAAEAGAEIALNQWNNGTKTNALSGNVQATVGGSASTIGTYSVTAVEDTANHMLTITSTGKEANAPADSNGQTIRIRASGQAGNSSAYPFQMGAFAKDSMVLASPNTDSYDSEKGAYGGSNKGSKGGVGTNSSVTGALKISGGPNLNGTVTAGPGTTLVKTAPKWSNPPPEGILPGWGTQYGGGYPKGTPAFSVLNDEFDLPDVEAPTNGTPFGNVPVIVDLANKRTAPSGNDSLVSARTYDQQGNSKNNNYTWDIPSGTYNLTSINMPGDQNVVNINGDVTFVVSGNVTTGGNTSFKFAPGASLKIVTSGNVDIGASFTNMDGTAPPPSKVQIQGTPSCTSIKYSGNTAFVGTIYAPEANVAFGGYSNIYGAVVGKTVDISGGGWIHYDEALGRLGLGGGQSESASWKLITWEQI